MRLFIAIEFSENIKFMLRRVQAEFSFSFNFTKDFHLTLKFLGEVAEENIEEISKKLREIRFNRFNLKLAGLGVFPNKSRPRVLWIGLNNNSELLRLQKEISCLFTNCGDNKDFHPHVTLARINSLKESDKFIETLKRIKLSELEFSVNSFSLIKSELTPKGPIYEVIQTFHSGNI